jgi:hypothetical protein
VHCIFKARDIRRVKMLKNLLATAVSLAAVVIFIVQGAVQWPATVTMLRRAMLGGCAGGRLVRVLPAQIARQAVIVAGTAMTVVCTWQYGASVAPPSAQRSCSRRIRRISRIASGCSCTLCSDGSTRSDSAPSRCALAKGTMPSLLAASGTLASAWPMMEW